MAMTYDESWALMQEFSFRGRVKVAVLKYANTKLVAPSTDPGFSAGYRWATNALLQPDQVASTVTPPTVMDPAVQEAGVDEAGKSLIPDAGLQGAVEGVVNRGL